MIIVFSGYLLIYNVMYISVTKDIRFYGMLKTIGTAPKQIKKIVKMQAYLGDGYYPPIIDIETFNKAEKIRISRATSLGRIKELDAPPKPKGAVSFTMPKVTIKYSDPFRQAEYAYSMIETEEVRDE